MSRQIMYEVVHPYHPDGKTVVHAPGDLLPLGADLPDGLRVREVIAEAPDPEPAKAPGTAKSAPAARPAAGKG